MSKNNIKLLKKYIYEGTEDISKIRNISYDTLYIASLIKPRENDNRYIINERIKTLFERLYNPIKNNKNIQQYYVNALRMKNYSLIKWLSTKESQILCFENDYKLEISKCPNQQCIQNVIDKLYTKYMDKPYNNLFCIELILNIGITDINKLTNINYLTDKYKIGNENILKSHKLLQILLKYNLKNNNLINQYKYPENIKLLLDFGFKPTEQTIPILLLIYLGDIEFSGYPKDEEYNSIYESLELLLQFGISPNNKNIITNLNDGIPQHLIYKFLKLLLDYKLNPNLKDNDGKYIIAQQYKIKDNPNIIKLLEQYNVDKQLLLELK